MQLQTSIKFSFAHFRLPPTRRSSTPGQRLRHPSPTVSIMLSPAGFVMPGPIGHLCRTPPTLNCHARHESAVSVQEKRISRTDAVPNMAKHPEKRSVGARSSPNSPRRLSPKTAVCPQSKNRGQTTKTNQLVDLVRLINLNTTNRHSFSFRMPLHPSNFRGGRNNNITYYRYSQLVIKPTMR